MLYHAAVSDELWIFGYGSLIWRPAFPYRERHPGYVVGFKRRFWQASTDHRGTPEMPGRVVTLLREPGAISWGMTYRVDDADAESVLAGLDHREKGGYDRLHTDVMLDPERGSVRALLYIATADNPNYVGPAGAIEEIARIVRLAHGPSGPNIEYVLRLAQALEAMGANDPHVAELARHASARKQANE